MLQVKTPEEVFTILQTEFHTLPRAAESVGLAEAAGRVLAADICAEEYVPDFNRSLVDGYAVQSRDTFGCSDAMPALLTLAGEVRMGQSPDFSVAADTCAAIPTGGAVPEGADAVQMLEYAEEYRDGTIGICKPVAPGNHMIYRGDDVYPGKVVLRKGRTLQAQDIGALAALGICRVPVLPRLRIGILSTGDELVPADQTPAPGQVRDINSSLLAAALASPERTVVPLGIVPDQEDKLRRAAEQALPQCDLLLISGGSSAGEKDATARVIAALGEVLFHGIAMKPGKPTILGRAGGKPVVGLPGHPVAAFFVTQMFVRPLIARLNGTVLRRGHVTAHLTENLSANHGRAQYTAVLLESRDGQVCAHPIHAKSGLITALAGADGFICIPRDCEGLPAGAEVSVILFS